MEITPAEILAHLEERNNPLTIGEIAEGLGLGRVGRRALPKLVAELKREGAIWELPGGRYFLSEAREAGAGQKGRKSAPSLLVPRKPGATDTITGRLVAHRDGYGFVVPDEPVPGMEGDLFIGRDALADAMHGDRVLAKVERRSSGAAGLGRAEGRILRVLGRAHPTIVGLFRYGSRGNTVLPYDTRILHEVVIPAGDELTPALRDKLGLGEEGPGRQARQARRIPRLVELDGAVVNVEILRFPKGGAAPVGRVREILGRPGELGVDVEIIIRKHHLPHVFAEDVLTEAERVARRPGEAEIGSREDFRDLPIVTIDGETARDYDDAVYVERRGAGWHLQVHIADVAHYVVREGRLDHEARLRGTSVYFPDRAVPMLPEALSNEMCSLKPKEDRLVMSALMDFDASGYMTGARFTPGVIRSAERMTYTNVNKVLEGDAEVTARYASLAEHFRAMKELALLLNARRAARGSIDFDLPEPVIEFDEEQRILNIIRSERNIAHRIVEEFMLAANRAVASYLLQRGLGALHRVHEKPDAKKVIEFEELARAFGYTLGVENLVEQRLPVRHGRVPAPARPGRPDSLGHGRERPMMAVRPGSGELKITPGHYQRLVRKLAGKPEERILSYLMLRSLKQARYAADSLGHFALGFDEYTHFTSPIRRYPDLIVHRVLKWALEHPPGPSKPATHHARHAAETAGPYPRGVLEEIAAESSEAERRADAAERELMDWKTAQFMESRLGDEFEALIISVQKFGFFVELLDVFVEGLVPITALEEATGARCVYRERDHAIVALLDSGRHVGRRAPRRGRTGQPASAGRPARAGKFLWRLGDRVRVRAERIDPMRRRVEFAPVEWMEQSTAAE
jgi:ribonuclease R